MPTLTDKAEAHEQNEWHVEVSSVTNKYKDRGGDLYIPYTCHLIFNQAIDL